MKEEAKISVMLKTKRQDFLEFLTFSSIIQPFYPGTTDILSVEFGKNHLQVLNDESSREVVEVN